MIDDYAEKSAALLARLDKLGNAVNVGATADRLARMNWSPALLQSVDDFMRIDRNRLIQLVEFVLKLSDRETLKRFPGITLAPDKARLTQGSLLVSAAELLWRLRRDELDAWDYVNELYEDD